MKKMLVWLLSLLLAVLPCAVLAEENPQAYVGEWHLCFASAGGMQGDLRALNGTLTLREDGTATMNAHIAAQETWGQAADGTMRFGEQGVLLTLLEDGFLKYGVDRSGYMIFSRDAEAVWTPSEEETSAAGGAIGEADRFNTKYSCSKYDAGGMTLDASAMGEISLLFREDGTCDFVMMGTAMPGCTWSRGTATLNGVERDAFIITYYTMTYAAVLTDSGFDMDYFGSMLLHFEKAE